LSRDAGSLLAYDRSMRYAQRGGYTPAEQQQRKRLRLEAAGRFARGDAINEIAHDPRVTPCSVRRWHCAWQDGGIEALRSKGPVSRERLSPQQWARLELELGKGPLAHGFAGDQRWTLGRIKTMIGMLFHVGYTPEGVWKLMRRHGWSCQVRYARPWNATKPRSRCGRTRCGPR
jgi:transposase